MMPRGRDQRGDKEGRVDAFSIAELAEEVAGEIYDILAAFFEDKPALQQLFSKLAEEEREHAERVRDLAKVWHRDKRAQPPALDVARMCQLVERARAFRDSLREAEVIDPYDAIRLAASIENDFNAAHAEAMAKERNPGMKALFEELAEGDEGHNELLAYLAELKKQGRIRSSGARSNVEASDRHQAPTAVVEDAARVETPTVVVPEKYQKWLQGAEEQLRRLPTEPTVVVTPAAKSNPSKA